MNNGAIKRRECMGEHTETYEREKLYDEVWKEPVLVVAKRYGLSNVGLAKACRKTRCPPSATRILGCDQGRTEGTSAATSAAL